MRTRTSRYDRRIHFFSLTAVRDPRFNTRKKEWLFRSRAWAEVKDILPSRGEQVNDGIDLQRKPCRVRIRWRDGISPDMRVKIGGEMFGIVSGPAELGRHEEIELVCELLSTQGDGP